MSAPSAPVPADPIREEVRRFDEARGCLDRARAIDRAPRFPAEEFQAMGRAHLLGLTIDPSLGGRGLPAERAGRGLFELAYRGGTMYAKLALQPEFSSLLAREASSAVREEWFRPLLRGERLVGNQVTEPTVGSDAAHLASVAEPDGGGYRLSGTKSEAAFADDAEAAIVYARAPAGITAFLVPQAGPGIVRRVAPDLGERWMRRGSVQYDHVRVEPGSRIGAEGRAFGYLRQELTHERAMLGAVYLGVAWAAWEEAVAYLGERSTFGQPLSTRQAVAFPLVEDQARLTAAWGLVERALRAVDGAAPAEADAAAALAKWYAAQVAIDAVDHAAHVHGGRGYSEELPFAQRIRDLRSARIAHGTDEVMHLVAARRLWPEAPSTAPKNA
jgi:cyclohexanecarboxyl-CoA dehydrogenase